VCYALTALAVIAMNRLYEELYMIYSKELMNLNIGYSYSKDNMNKMMDIVGTINYLQQCPHSKDVLKHISIYYE
jgi:hypothetical protein